jgi:methionyl-tRNA formyltransferase
MQKLNISYFGTPDFSADFLEQILNDKEILVNIKLVVTQEDKKVGRKQILTPSPVRKIAEKYNIPVCFDFKSEFINKAKELNIDLGVVFAYGNIIPDETLHSLKYGFWIIHPSLLPKYKGASPIASCLINGDKITGTTIIKATYEVDAGDIIGQEKLEIQNKERCDSLTKRLTDSSYKLFKNKINEFVNNNFQIHLTKQEVGDYKITKQFEKKHGFIEFNILKSGQDSEKTFNLFRGLYPWPGIWTIVKINNKKMRLKIIDLDLENNKLILKKVQLEGKKIVDFETFNRAYKIL